MQIAINEKLKLADQEKVINQSTDWQSERKMPISTLVFGAIISVIFLISGEMEPGLITLLLFGIYFSYQFWLRPISSGKTVLTNKRLFLIIQEKGPFIERSLMDSVKLSSIVGANPGQGFLLRGGRWINVPIGEAVEDIFCKILELRNQSK